MYQVIWTTDDGMRAAFAPLIPIQNEPKAEVARFPQDETLCSSESESRLQLPRV
jgi:hypothetical protein